MPEQPERVASRRPLRAGDTVEIRPEADILATLDATGALDGLPFMPEMAAWCGRRATVSRRADKTCDTVHFTGQLRLRETVHLAGLRCDGSAHGGCQASCLTFWKEAWLVRVDAATPVPPMPKQLGPQVRPAPATTGAGCTRADLDAATRSGRGRDGADGDSDTVYRCQATRMPEASERLRWFDLRQYVRDVRNRDVGPVTSLVTTIIFLFNNMQGVSRRFLPERLRFRGGSWYPFVNGHLDKTPAEILDLSPGEIVEIKSREEILATLNRSAKNRGMSFDVEMVPFCGRQARVLRRVDQLIDEKTGRMVYPPSACIVLDGVFCTGRYHGMCPREVYPYWREIWLRRIPASGPESSTAVSPSAPAPSDTREPPITRL